MEFVEALQEFLFHQGFQKIKYDSKILWGKDTGDKLSLLEVVPPLLPGQPRIGLKQLIRSSQSNRIVKSIKPTVSSRSFNRLKLLVSYFGTNGFNG